MNRSSPYGLMFGARLQEIREQYGFTQEELATQALVPRSHLSKIESGRGNPTLRTIVKLCQVLGISLQRFFAFE